MNQRNDRELCEHLAKMRRALNGDGRDLRRLDEVSSIRALANRLADIQAAAREAEWRCNQIEKEQSA